MFSGTSYKGKGKQHGTSFWPLSSPLETMGILVPSFFYINVQKAEDVGGIYSLVDGCGSISEDENEMKTRAPCWNSLSLIHLLYCRY